MRLTARLLMTASVIALAPFWAGPVPAQIIPPVAERPGSDLAVRSQAETALLYATTLDRLARIIEQDIGADPGITVVAGLRTGRLDTLPSLDAELRDLIAALQIGVRVMDADPDPVRADERAIIFVADGDLRNGVTRADIEAAARDAGITRISRLQENQILGPDGALTVPSGMSGLPSAAAAVHIGIRAADLVTSSGAGSETMRTLPCPDGQFGTGIVERQDVARTTTLGGAVTETAGAWTEMSRSCTPEYEETVRVFGACTTASGGAGTAVYEMTQHVGRDPMDPFGTVITVDEASRALVSEIGCVEMDMVDDPRNFLVEGGSTAQRELELRTATDAGDIGSGVNRVPRDVDGGPVASIPFPASSVSDFAFGRSCAAEYGPVAMPSTALNPSGTGTGAWYGDATFSGSVAWYRDYNRRETGFSDDPFAYILNYDIVLDPNPFGHIAKGRQTVPSSYDLSPSPSGNGWYRSAQSCSRYLARVETQSGVRRCSPVTATYPLGSYYIRRDGTGIYLQTLPLFGATQNPTLASISWGNWYVTYNGCYRQDVSEDVWTRVIQVWVGAETCDQAQKWVTTYLTYTYQTGATSTIVTSDSGWFNDGAPYNCFNPYAPVYTSEGDSTQREEGSRDWADIDGDGWGDMGLGEANSLGLGYETVDSYRPSEEAVAIEDAARSVSNTNDSDGGGGGGDDSCFAAGTLIRMADGTERPIETVRIGDVLAHGGRVYMTGRFLASDLYRLNGVAVTGGHLVRVETGWIPVRAHPRAVRLLGPERPVYNLATIGNRICAGDLLFSDYAEVAGPLVEDLLAAARAEQRPAKRTG